MNNNQPAVPIRRRAGFLEALLKGALGGLWLGAFLFIAAGRLDWPMAWIYTGISIVDGILLLLVVNPELMRERTHPKADAKAWDRVPARLTGPLGSTVILIVAGLDKRFGWSAQVPLAIPLAGLAAFVFGIGLMTWAMAVNNYFSPFFSWANNLRVTLTQVGARSHWALNHGTDLERWSEGIRLLDERYPFQSPEPRLRRALKVRLVPFLATGIGGFRYQL